MNTEVEDISGQIGKAEDTKNGTVTGQSKSTVPFSRAAKTHQDYWKERVVRRPYVDADGKRCVPPEFSVRMRHLGRDVCFNLETANAAAAAVKARDIHLSLVAAGWEPTLEKFKPKPEAKAEVCAVGEFLADVGQRSHLKAMTLRRYAVKLRKMVADVAKLEEGLKKKDRRAKYDYVNGGRKAWLAKIDGQPLSVLTAEAVKVWRNEYVAKAGADPVARKSAERSAASYLRCVRALFASDVLSVLQVKLPENPFKGVKLKDPGPQRYHSDVSAEWLLVCAESELRGSEPQAFLGLTLALWGGLRRKEADLLTWKQIDLREGKIHIRRTEWFEPKTEESVRVVDLAPAAVEIIKGYKKQGRGEFVMDGGDPNPAASYDYYRADCTWRKLVAWLKKKGVKQAKAVHGLRKESGSLIASDFGIEAARHHLGHRDIRTTSSHYVAKRKRVEVGLALGGGELKAIAGGGGR